MRIKAGIFNGIIYAEFRKIFHVGEGKSIAISTLDIGHIGCTQHGSRYYKEATQLWKY